MALSVMQKISLMIMHSEQIKEGNFEEAKIIFRDLKLNHATIGSIAQLPKFLIDMGNFPIKIKKVSRCDIK